MDIPAGTFLMGSPATEPEREDWEGPQTLVTLTYAFRMGKYEVQQSEYQAVIGTNPSYYAGHTNRPVEQVTWDDAMEYCRCLTEGQRSAGCLPAGMVYRLPTEAEWEYACRAGNTNAFGFGPTCGPAWRTSMAISNTIKCWGPLTILRESIWAARQPSAAIPQTLGDFTTCTAMSGNGAWTAGARSCREEQ